ncbi:LacI family DNA-binding transcriptional regulator [Herbiconiux sp. 11R-BC]|uniref:LacI family DNA-binding transcriptional regulator n=1 Tax=Herbiconiux sp. 11R-BC TaxID=3111637 RepID=UPI003BFC935C
MAAPTMNDVAREAGVALKTVSRFVNGETNINPAMAARIAAAITALGYRRNLAAASIRPGWTSRTLGLVISDLANPYYSVLTRAIESRAREHGYLVISASSDENGQQHDRIVDRLMEQRIDALIVVPPREAGRDWSSVTPPIPPLVFLDRPVDFPAADVILADNAGGARSAVAELVRNGARRIAFVSDDLSIYTMSERHAGYRQALAEVGLPVDEEIVTSSAHSSEDAAAVVGRLLRDERVDAVFAANNRASVGALLAFREHRRVPLIGFDDFEAALLGDPAVSVVSQDIQEMGRLAAEIVFRRLAGDPVAATTHVLPTRLVLRGSERP